MGDIAIDLFQETLKQHITSSKLDLIVAEKHQLESLEEEITYLRGFLKVTEKKRNEHSEVMKLVMQIRDVVSEAENIVELFTIDAVNADESYSLCDHLSLHFFFKDQDNLSLDLQSVKKKIKTLLAEVEQIYDQKMYDINGVKKLEHSSTGSGAKPDRANRGLLQRLHENAKRRFVGWREREQRYVKKTGGDSSLDPTFKPRFNSIFRYHHRQSNPFSQTHLRSGTIDTGGSGSPRGMNTCKVIGEKLVGFKEDVEKLIEQLDDKGEGRPLEIISIIGAAGGGKTSLAREVYDDPYTSYRFEIRAWVNVSQDYDKTMKIDLLSGILESASLEKLEDYEKTSEDRLGEKVLKCLKGRKYLIVMDDIWGMEAWNDIQRSFPKECKGSKVLFTSRQLVQPDSVPCVSHFLAPLPKRWSWELLRKKVFGMRRCPPELVDTGEQIAEKCGGLPLALVTIAGILATEDKTLDVWEQVAKSLSSTIANKQEGCMDTLELSYNHLPLHLKACFLYIGAFPEDYEIPVRELIWLWIAEGFIQQSEGGKSLEAIAEDYLISLIDRSLVMVSRKGSFGGIKACRIHDLLRVLCLKKAKEDNFLVQIYGYDFFLERPPITIDKHRRLFIDGQSFRPFSFRAVAPYLRSFVCPNLPKSSHISIEENLSFFVRNFKLLRVLMFNPAVCPGEIRIGHLVHLRYLAFGLPRDNWPNLAVPFSYLLNLETLNLQASSNLFTIKLPRNIFKMVKLRHLYTNGVFHYHSSFCLSKEAMRVDSEYIDHSFRLDNLQTLRRICACEECRSFLVSTPNLRKLGVYGKLMSKDGVLMLPDLEFLKCLETLSFTNEWMPINPVAATTLPPGLKLPLTVTRLTLKDTRLKWEELSILQTLTSLEVLKLLRFACCGPIWNTSELDQGFPQLKYLRFNRLDIKEWNASEDQFPRLEVLVLELCMKLEQIPNDFANMYELREIKLEKCSWSAEKSAREIQEEQRNKLGDDGCLNLILIGNIFRWPPRRSRYLS